MCISEYISVLSSEWSKIFGTSFISQAKDPVLDLTIYNLFTTISGWITIHTFLKCHRYIYIRPSKYLKALRNEFPKFYPQIHIIVQKVQKISFSRSFSIATKVLTTIYIDKGTQKVKKPKPTKGLYNCISAVACNKYSIFYLQKGKEHWIKELNRKTIHKYRSLLFLVQKEHSSVRVTGQYTHTHTQPACHWTHTLAHTHTLDTE